jgi:tetratricopeptide (TPR) repeat protein
MLKIITACAVVLCLSLPARADDVQDASKLLKAGQHQQALERVNKVLATKPRDPQARFLKGLILTEQGKTQDAIEIFTQLTKDHPELPEPYNNLAVIYASQGQYDKARIALERSIRTHPSYATAYENLGDVYAKLASQAYNKALQIDSSNTGAQNKLSLVRELVGGPAPAAAVKEPPKPPVVVAEKKAPERVEKPVPAPAADPAAEVLKAVDAWAEAWSRKDADAYLSHYARDFDPPGKQSRTDWEKSRRSRIDAPKSISVSIASPKVTMGGSDSARVTFRQTYRSDIFTGTSNKTLILVRADGRWQIREEKGG